jgi:hypothetical protein
MVPCAMRAGPLEDASKPPFGRHGFSGSHTSLLSVLRAYLAAAGPSAESYEIPESGHAGGLAARPKEYKARVTSFLGEVLGTDE